jgi:hypothetical protein
MKLRARRLSALGASFALHLVAAIVVTSLTPPVRTFLRVERSTPQVAFVQRSEARPVDAIPDDLGIQLDEGASNFSLPGFSFDFEKIARRAVQLFPFLTGSPSFETLVVPPVDDGRISWGNMFRQLRGEAAKPPLALDDNALQALVDKSWSRRNRWQGFQIIAAATDVYHPDVGSLPALLRGYGAQNGLQPYEEGEIRDPRLWAQLGLAADHADFIGFVSQYASQHPSSRTTTELLFLLDKLAQASLDALVTLVGTVPEADLQWTQKANRRAYDAIVTIREYYRIQLERRDLRSSQAIAASYGETRLAILRSILRTTPDEYRASDARFLIGEIYWKQGRTEDALRSWRDLAVDAEDAYATASSQVLAAIRAADGGTPNARDIQWILDGEQGRWVVFSIARLRQFGYHVDTF